MQGVLNVSKRPAKIKLRIEAVGLQAGQSVRVTDVMFQPGGAVSGWLPHTTEMPWAAGINDQQGGATEMVHWDDIVGRPGTFPPEHHTHTMAEVTDLTKALAAAEARTAALESELEATSAPITLTDTTNFEEYATGTMPIGVMKAGLVTIMGTLRLVTPGYLDGVTYRVVGKVPAGMEPGGGKSASAVMQGSGRNRYFLEVQANGRIRMARYGPGNSTNNAWLNINVTYQQVPQ